MGPTACGAKHRSCPEGWMAYGQSCFLKKTDDTATWAEAEAKCATAGGSNNAHLASCITPDEMDFLSGKCAEKTDYWIGFRDRSVALKHIF